MENKRELNGNGDSEASLCSRNPLGRAGNHPDCFPVQGRIDTPVNGDVFYGSVGRDRESERDPALDAILLCLLRIVEHRIHPLCEFTHIPAVERGGTVHFLHRYESVRFCRKSVDGGIGSNGDIIVFFLG